MIHWLQHIIEFGNYDPIANRASSKVIKKPITARYARLILSDFLTV